MRNTRKLCISFSLAAALAVTACGDDPAWPGNGTGNGTPAEGIRFDYSGSQSGRFEAAGPPPSDTAGTVLTQFAGAVETADSVIGIVAFQPRTTTTGDAFLLLLGRVRQPGTILTNPMACMEGILQSCVIGVFMLGVALTDLDGILEGEAPLEEALTGDSFFQFSSGEIEILQRDAETVSGTFSGTAFLLADAQIGLELGAGSFNLPVIRSDSLPD